MPVEVVHSTTLNVYPILSLPSSRAEGQGRGGRRRPNVCCYSTRETEKGGDERKKETQRSVCGLFFFLSGKDYCGTRILCYGNGLLSFWGPGVIIRIYPIRPYEYKFALNSDGIGVDGYTPCVNYAGFFLPPSTCQLGHEMPDRQNLYAKSENVVFFFPYIC